MSSGLPQLDYSTYSSQIFWLAISFLILYFSISKIFVPKLTDFLKAREKYVDNIYEKITEDREQIVLLNNKYQMLIGESNQTVNQILNEANEKVSEISANNHQLIEKNILAMKEETSGSIKGNLNAMKEHIYNDSELILKSFFEKFSIKDSQLNEENLDSEFDAMWAEKFNKVK